MGRDKPGVAPFKVRLASARDLRHERARFRLCTHNYTSFYTLALVQMGMLCRVIRVTAHKEGCTAT